MITIDTSVLIAVLRGEPNAGALLTALNDSDTIQISAGTLLETGIVADAHGVGDALDELLTEIDAEVHPVTEEHAAQARAAYRRYGKGSGPGANLNFGDCFAYALAKASQTPLLFQGDDFTHTDVHPAF